MAKVYAIHEIALKPGVNEQDFEQFVTRALGSAPVPGVTTHLLKGDRGKRKGQYALLTEFDSVDVRNQYYPTEGSEPVGMEAPSQDVIEKWSSLSPTVLGDPDLYTDYVEVDQ